jgi:DNA-directed RNA polymerase subunit RPC12/RpoP
MHCLRCGVQLAANYKEPLCAYCRSQITIEEISKDPVWALHKVLEILATEVDNLKKRIQELEKVYVKTEV